MASLSNDPRLFGVDLRALGQGLRLAWQRLQRSPALSWVDPKPLVLLRGANGRDQVWRCAAAPHPAPGRAATDARFSAVELPPDLVLQREIRVPELSDAQVREAVALDAQSASPFAPGDLVWGWARLGPAPGQETSKVLVALASRKQVEAHLAGQAQRKLDAGHPVDIPEVWALSADEGHAVVIEGFGEGRRASHTARWRGLGYGLQATAVALALAIAGTPTAQLRLRAVEAVNSTTALVQRTQPLLNKREALIKASEQLAAFQDMQAASIDAPRVMDIITRALPDDTSLQNLQIDGAKVSLSGQTDNAAALMSRLSGEPGLSEVKAPSAATRPPGATKETFRIDFVVEAKPRPSQPAAEPVASPASTAAPAVDTPSTEAPATAATPPAATPSVTAPPAATTPAAAPSVSPTAALPASGAASATAGATPAKSPFSVGGKR